MDHPVHAVWAVQIKATGRLAGTLLLKSIPASGRSLPLQPSGDTEIGWHFHPDHWGHGYASEAAAAALEYAFTSGLKRVVAVTAPANTASQRVCGRIGMRHLGQTTEYYNSLCDKPSQPGCGRALGAFRRAFRSQRSAVHPWPHGTDG
jgi:RimJ/RimL family protein N-acetyltransferase